MPKEEGLGAQGSETYSPSSLRRSSDEWWPVRCAPQARESRPALGGRARLAPSRCSPTSAFEVASPGSTSGRPCFYAIGLGGSNSGHRPPRAPRRVDGGPARTAPWAIVEGRPRRRWPLIALTARPAPRAPTAVGGQSQDRRAGRGLFGGANSLFFSTSALARGIDAARCGRSIASRLFARGNRRPFRPRAGCTANVAFREPLNRAVGEAPIPSARWRPRGQRPLSRRERRATHARARPVSVEALEGAEASGAFRHRRWSPRARSASPCSTSPDGSDGQSLSTPGGMVREGRFEELVSPLRRHRAEPSALTELRPGSRRPPRFRAHLGRPMESLASLELVGDDVPQGAHRPVSAAFRRPVAVRLATCSPPIRPALISDRSRVARAHPVVS